jgi:Lon protease-like protein
VATATLPDRIPIFPLPNVVLFPHVFLPLHIFEARYREMVADAIDGDRLIGMVLLRDGWQRHAGPNPPIFPIGCAGRLTHVAALPDGRYNIVLRGVDRFRVLNEDLSRAYRIGMIELLADGSTAGRQEHLQGGRRRIEDLLDRQAAAGAAARIPPGMADAELVNVLSQYLAFEPIEKQALLEKGGPCERCAALIDLLEMRLMTSGKPFSAGGVQ